MRSLARALALLLLLVLPSCVGTPEAGERLAASKQAFTSAEALLFDFDFDGKVLAAAGPVADPRSLIVAQLQYTVGQLNADRAVGRLGQLVLSAITVQQTATNAEITYHAKLPVGWAGPPAAPSGYTFTLPARVTQNDLIDFATKYGATCSDPSGGVVDAWRMFLFYRPGRSGCVFDANDVVTFAATTAPSTEGTTGKYPEYHRIWDDGALDVVVMFSRANETVSEPDEGLDAYGELVRRARAYLSSLQPDATKRTEPDGATAPDPVAPRVKLGAILADGRRIGIDVMLVPYHIGENASSFDAWFDSVTPGADEILYSGHAALGWNVRALTQKGSFKPGKYVVWGVNGCDTFAYLDRTLADRRALLNPDDASGTKYMDQVSNVMAGYFNTSPAFAMSFIDAAVTAANPQGTPRTYPQILAAIDAEQVVVVTGEEDNEFDPKTHRAWVAPASAAPPVNTSSPAPAPAPPERIVTSQDTGAPRGASGCAMGGAPVDGAWGALLLAVAGIITSLRRRQRSPLRPRSRSSAPRRPTAAGRDRCRAVGHAAAIHALSPNPACSRAEQRLATARRRRQLR